MINNMISIPVHEKTEVVLDQIVNYRRFCPDCGIVLHISEKFNYADSFHNEKEFLFILSTLENVFVNPRHMNTGYADIVQTHVSNFEYVSKIVDFEYFSMGASNDLFVRDMPKIEDCDLSVEYGDLINESNWNWYNHTLRDDYLKQILDYLGAKVSDVKVSQIEGSTYKKELFGGIVDVIKKFYDYDRVVNESKVIYPREEVYYSTIAYMLNKNLKNTKSNYTFVAWQSPGMAPTREELFKVLQGAMEGKYSVKRVSRTINDPVRFMIGTAVGNYRTHSFELIKIRMSKVYRNLFNLGSYRRRIFIGHNNDERRIMDIFNVKTGEIFLPFKINELNVVDLGEIIFAMKLSRDALFVICSTSYPLIAQILIQNGFRENVDFIDATLLID